MALLLFPFHGVDVCFPSSRRSFVRSLTITLTLSHVQYRYCSRLADNPKIPLLLLDASSKVKQTQPGFISGNKNHLAQAH
jgi:hypothetical protein